MNNALNQKALEITKQVLTDYWHGKTELLYKILHPNIMWIGSMEWEYVFGDKAMKSQIDSIILQMEPINLKNWEAGIVCSDENTVVISLRYIGFTDPLSKIILSERQKCTFVWTILKGELKLIHLHLSNNLHMQDDDEKFPVRAGKQTYEYMQSLLKSCHQNQRIEITSGSFSHYVDVTSIIYIEAQGPKSIVFCLDKAITTNVMLGEIEKQLSKQFYRVHRGYLINCSYIESITRFSILMKNGISIPIPAKKYACVKAEIDDIIKNGGTL